MVNRHHINRGINRGIVDAFLGENWMMALANNGELYGTGDNKYNPMGFGDQGKRYVLSKIQNSPIGIKQVYPSDRWSYILTETNELYVVGANDEGQLGLGDKTNRLVYTEVNSRPDDIKLLSLGCKHAKILTDSGDIWATGYNQYGSYGSTANSVNFKKLTGLPVGIVDIFSGYAHTMILTDTNDLYASGYNYNGQLGLGDFTNKTAFTKVTNRPANIKKVFINPYGFNTFILTNAGEVYGCGMNGSGQLGVGDNTSYPMFRKIEGLPNNVIHIESGSYCTLCLTESGELFGCGYNYHGAIGWGDVQANNIFTTKIDGLPTDIIKLGHREINTAVISASGELYVCGNGTYGQLGLGDTTENTTDKSSFTKVEVDF